MIVVTLCPISFFRRLACKMDGAKERVVETLRIKVKELVTLGKEPVVSQSCMIFFQILVNL